MRGPYRRRLPFVGRQTVPGAAGTVNWSLIQSAQNEGSGAISLSKAFTANVTQGDLLIAFGQINGAAPTSMVVSDSAGNTWSQATVSSKDPTFANLTSLWWTVAGASGADTVTVTQNTGAGPLNLEIAEFRPGATPTSFTISLDTAVNALQTGSTFTPDCGTISVAGAGEMCVAAAGGNSASLSGASGTNTGWTFLQQRATQPWLLSEYILNVSTAQDGSFTLSTARPWTAVGASFKAV